MSEKSDKNKSKDQLARLKKRIDPREWVVLSERIKSDKGFRRMVEILCDYGDRSEQSPLTAIFPAARSLADGIINSTIGKGSGGTRNRGIITYDSRLLPAPAGIRESAVEHRRLRVVAGEGTILISIYPDTPKTHRLMGKLTAEIISESVTVRLTQGKRALTETCSNRGIFEFAGVRSGRIRMLVRSERTVITDFEIEI